MVLYNNSLYYNCYNSRDMCRYNIDTGRVQRETLRGAAFNNRHSYAGIAYQNMDFAVDETGLWIIYCPEANAGNAVIGKINVTTFTVEKTWVTKLFKPSVTNAFMICGVLYAIRPVSPQSEEIFYTFDTRTGQQGMVSIKMSKIIEQLQSVNYNIADHKVWKSLEEIWVHWGISILQPWVRFRCQNTNFFLPHLASALQLSDELLLETFSALTLWCSEYP
ncbi:olfactomedin-like [Stegostoma tigrinum]|uniref:olfactomedin-like n=1 Tax=Stegostoma tigrinum TaxID=3053191 RepID=UPI0028705198|nr:olfactomedin-like [Stegostoma tigrinum]